MAVRLAVLIGLVAACSASSVRPPSPGGVDVSSSNGVSLSFPAGSSRVSDPDHDVALSAALLPGRTFPVTLDPYPAAAAPSFAAFADQRRVTAEDVTTFDESFDRNGFTVRYIRHERAGGDFNRFTALAVSGDRALVVRLVGPDQILTSAEISALDRAFRAVLESVR